MRMDIEIQALLVHAARCREVAAETKHKLAARKLKELAAEYELRAEALAANDRQGKSV